MSDKEQIKAIIKQYADKGERLFLEASESNEGYAESYWDGYKDCADGLLRELEDVQEEPVSEDNTLRKASEEYLKVLSETPYNNTPIINAQTIVRELVSFLDNPSKYNPNHIEETVSEDLEEAAKHYLYSNILYDDVYVGNPTDKDCIEMFKAGANWQKEHLLKPADGDDLPDFDREVIVLTQHYPLEGNEYAVYFAHRPNPDGWDGKSIATGKVEHYTPKTYGKGGWNIPDVKYWLDIIFPNK